MLIIILLIKLNKYFKLLHMIIKKYNIFLILILQKIFSIKILIIMEI